MVLIVTSFVAVFLLLASGGLLLFYRDATLQRITAAVTPRVPRAKGLRGNIERSKAVLSDFVDPFERVLPKSQAEVSIVQQRLIRAGFRQDSAIKNFYAAKVLVPLTLALLALVSGVGAMNPFFVYSMALGLGYLVPDFWLGRRIKERQKRIRLGLPDVLDLMVVCMEAGLSMDGAVSRTAQELRRGQPALSDELGILVLEQRAGRTRSEAWKELAARTDVDVVRNLVSVLVQADQLGTSVAKTLRVHSEGMRVQRRQTIEEQAAKTTVKLIFPLVFFIFPSLFVVVLGPAVIVMIQSFQTYFK